MRRAARPPFTTVLVCALLLANAAAASATIREDAAGRHAGGTRFETAVAISQAAFPDEAETVYLARADSFPDALAAGTLTNGPILLAPQSGRVPDPVIAEVDRLNPDAVIALGGPAAIAESVLEAASDGRPTSRLAGPDRFSTAVQISQAAFPDGATDVYLARADAFPDALAAGALSRGPILLVPGTGEVPDVVLDEIDRLGASKVFALGGEAAVASSVLDQTAAPARRLNRLAGDTRYETAIRIAQRASRTNPDVLYLARADTFPDALAAGALDDGPVLLVPPCGPLPEAVSHALPYIRPERVVALGGPGAICQDTLIAAAEASPDTAPREPWEYRATDPAYDHTCTKPDYDNWDGESQEPPVVETPCGEEGGQGDIIIYEQELAGRTIEFTVESRVFTTAEIVRQAIEWADPDSGRTLRWDYSDPYVSGDTSNEVTATNRNGDPTPPPACVDSFSLTNGLPRVALTTYFADPGCLEAMDFATWPVTIEIEHAWDNYTRSSDVLTVDPNQPQ